MYTRDYKILNITEPLQIDPSPFLTNKDLKGNNMNQEFILQEFQNLIPEEHLRFIRLKKTLDE